MLECKLFLDGNGSIKTQATEARSKCGGTMWTLEQIKLRIIDE